MTAGVSRKNLHLLLFAFVLDGAFFVDFATKAWLFPADADATERIRPLVAGVIALTNHRNTGITFDLPLPLALTIAITLAVLALVTYGMVRAFRSGTWTDLWAYALVYGGALGNLIDRLRFGYVRDWLLLFGRSALNIADLAILVGLAWLVLHPTPEKKETQDI